MASTNKTTNYELNQWLGNDYIKREDFNNDNELIDSALKANADAITSEAAARAAGDSVLEDLVSDINTNFATNVRNAALAGLSIATNAVISASDTILTALGKLQAQITSLSTTKANLVSPTFAGTVTLPSTTSIGNVSSIEMGYLDGVTSKIQTQLNAKAPMASPALTGTPTIAGNIAYHAGNITISTAAPSSALTNGYQHQVY